MYSKIIKGTILIILLYLLSCESTNEPNDKNEIKFKVQLHLQLDTDFEHISYRLKGDAFYYDSRISIYAGNLTVSNVDLRFDTLLAYGELSYRNTYQKTGLWDSINNLPTLGTVSNWSIEGDKEIGLKSFSIDYYTPQAIFITSPKQNEDISIKEGAYIRWNDPDYLNESISIHYSIYKGDSHIRIYDRAYKIKNTGFHYILFDTIDCEVNDRIKIGVLSMTDTAFQIENSKVYIYMAYGADETYTLVE